MKTAKRRDSRGFTRLEVLACVLGCALAMAVILPGLANSTARSDRVVCLNNLRQIGVAYSNFGLERNDLPPWRVLMSEGGNSNHPLKQNLYVQFVAISNFLATPKPLADPADMRRNIRPASHWRATDGGIWNPGYQNNSVSYFLGLHGDMRMPREVLSGDRNLFASGGISTCSSGISPVTILERDVARWTNAVHGLTGNVLFFDGSVKQVDSPGFREAIFTGPANDDVAGANGSRTHILATFQ